MLGHGCDRCLRAGRTVVLSALSFVGHLIIGFYQSALFQGLLKFLENAYIDFTGKVYYACGAAVGTVEGLWLVARHASSLINANGNSVRVGGEPESITVRNENMIISHREMWAYLFPTPPGTQAWGSPVRYSYYDFRPAYPPVNPFEHPSPSRSP